MTVQTNFRIDTNPWRGFQEDALPASSYIAQGVEVGDASGGAAIIKFLFQIASDPLSSRLFNIEQLMLSTTQSLTQIANGVISNMGHLAPDRPLADRQFSVQLLTSPSEFAASRNQEFGTSMFLGAPSGAGLECGVEFRFDNADLSVFRATIQGYIWEPRSILAPGGLQRPTTALWGR